MPSSSPPSATAVAFPDDLPPGYEWLPGDPPFDPGVHLRLELPTSVVSLADLGYDEAEIDNKATEIAISAPFRLLSDEGVSVMLATARRLSEFAKPAGDRIERMVRGGCYRSRWLRDFCLSPEVTKHLSEIYKTAVAPHPMALHLGHLNYEPSKVGAAVDKWHHDTLPLDYVLMVTDPKTMKGGRFQYFHGTKAEASELQASGKLLPEDRIVTPDLPGPGWAVALHGDMVVHRGAPLEEKSERITMVNGYVSTNPTHEDQSRSADLMEVDDPNILFTEWAKFEAWKASQRLNAIINELKFTDDVAMVADQLDIAVANVVSASDQMRQKPTGIAHYEKSE